MIWNNLRRGTGALALVAVLAAPGVVSAAPAGADRMAFEPLSGLAFLWDALAALFEGDETTTSTGIGSDTGGGTDNSGGAMDPNGCPTCKPKTDPPTSGTP
ncbi:MAG TPA: hypothetical protein VJ885_12785 [Thermoanaerobaculia bacterium]|nr:hypothetical protein [Thermoanaerobaculia bacterium]